MHRYVILDKKLITSRFDSCTYFMVPYNMVGQKPQIIKENISSDNTRPKKGRVLCFCGSFKFYQEMEKAAGILRKAGFEVIVPQPSHIRHGHKPEELKAKYDQKTLTRWEGEGAFSHLANIRKSDVVYIFNKASYLGPAVTVEIGYALALAKPIFSKAKVADITVTNFIKSVVSPKGLLKLLKL